MLIYRLLFPVVAVLLPFFVLGLVRKLKANLQGRMGPPLHQPLLDFIKLLRKGQVLSEYSSWVLRGAAASSCAACLLLALSAPWLGSIHPVIYLDIFSFIYILVFVRLVTLLNAADSNSAFGGFSASREVVLSVLVEPAVMLCLISLAVAGKTASLDQIFSFQDPSLVHHLGLWLLAGCGLYIASLVELSRMPVDDPTTHLELTMVHEAMILENSGPNLAAVEYAAAIKMSVLLGISSQCFLHAIGPLWSASPEAQALAGVAAVLILAGLTAAIETTVTKLRWTRVPEFVAYAVGFGLLCLIQTVGG